MATTSLPSKGRSAKGLDSILGEVFRQLGERVIDSARLIASDTVRPNGISPTELTLWVSLPGVANVSRERVRCTW